MKKIILGFALLFLLMQVVHAQEDIIEVELSAKNISLNDRIKYTVNISQDTPGGLTGELKIPGLENFNIFSQSSGHSFENINGVSTGVSQYTFDMSPKLEGEFNIGPAQIVNGSGGFIDDTKLFITVTSDTLETLEITEEEGAGTVSQGEERADFVSLRKQETNKWLWIIGIGAFLLAFYCLLSLALRRKTEIVEVISDSRDSGEWDFSDQMMKYFAKLEKKSSSLTTQDFLKIFNHGLRLTLQNRGVENALTSTLTQLKVDEEFNNFELSKLFGKAYKAEYTKKEITNVTKKKYIDEVKNYLK